MRGGPTLREIVVNSATARGETWAFICKGRFYAALLTELGNVSRVWAVTAAVAQGSPNAVVLQLWRWGTDVLQPSNIAHSEIVE